MKKSTLFILIALIAGLLIGYGMARQKPALPGDDKEDGEDGEVTEEGPIKIGVLADLTGDYADFLRGIPQGAELAVEDLQGKSKREVKLIIEDQKSCDAKETVSIMNKFVSVDKVDAVIGGTCSSTTLAAAPIAEQSKIILISAASSAPSISKAGEYVFRTYISDTIRAEQGARLAYELGKKKMAVITDSSNDATVELSKRSIASFKEVGGVVVIEETIGKDVLDFRTPVAKIKEQNPDVLFVSITGPKQIGLLARQAKELGLNVQMISPLESVEAPDTLDIGGDAVNGFIYIMPGNPPISPAYRVLVEKYRAKYQTDSLPPYVTEAYDAVMLAVKAIEASNGTRDDIKNKLYEVSKIYEGVSGSVAFDLNGDVTKSILIKQIKDGKFIEYDLSAQKSNIETVQ